MKVPTCNTTNFSLCGRLEIIKNPNLFPMAWSITVWLTADDIDTTRNLVKEMYTDNSGDSVECWGLSYPSRFQYGEHAYGSALEIKQDTLSMNKKSTDFRRQLHIWTFIYDFENKWAQFGIDGKLQPRINGTAFPDAPIAECNSKSKIYVGGKGITLGGLQVHPRALSADEFLEMHTIGATITDLARRPVVPVLDTFAPLIDTGVPDQSKEEESVGGSDMVSLNNANDMRTDSVMSGQLISSVRSANRVIHVNGLRCVVGSRCVIRIKGVTGSLSLSSHNVMFMALMVPGQKVCGTAAVKAALASKQSSTGHTRWAIPASPVLANTAPRESNGSCPLGYATYVAGGGKWPCTVTTAVSPYKPLDKQATTSKSTELHLNGS